MLNNESLPYVSVILPTFNRADKIMASIDSVLRQTYSNYELIVIDDGSVDRTKEVISAIEDSRVRYIKLDQNRGQAAARNIGIQSAIGDYIAFQDSDDKWLPGKLEMQVNALKETGADTGISYHQMRYSTEQDNTILVPGSDMDICNKSGDIYRELLMHNIIGMPTLVVKKSCIDDVGMFDETMRSLEDYDFVLRLAKKYKAIYIDEVLLEASMSDGGVSSNIVNYMISNCLLVQRYKEDYLKTDTLNYRLDKILAEAAYVGIQTEIVAFLEKIMTM